jgi:CRISPR-associated protein Csm2
MSTVFNNIDGEILVKSWINNGLTREAVQYADDFAKDLVDNKLSTSQIRAAFGEVRRIQMKGLTESFDSQVLLIKPKLAYAKARKSGVDKRAADAADDLRKVLSKAIDAIFENEPEKKFQRFENFASFFEAILAYHKAHGGK